MFVFLFNLKGFIRLKIGILQCSICLDLSLFLHSPPIHSAHGQSVILLTISTLTAAACLGGIEICKAISSWLISQHVSLVHFQWKQPLYWSPHHAILSFLVSTALLLSVNSISCTAFASSIVCIWWSFRSSFGGVAGFTHFFFFFLDGTLKLIYKEFLRLLCVWCRFFPLGCCF